MLKKAITYTDFNGNTVTEDFYFHMSKAELLEMELIHPEGLKGWLDTIIKNDDRQQILKTFKEVILNSYGEKDPSGRRFIKSPEMAAAFEQSPAYSELYLELCTDADAAANFMNGIVPFDHQQDKPELAEAKVMD